MAARGSLLGFLPALVTLLASCGGKASGDDAAPDGGQTPPSSAPEWRSGDRLRARILAAGDGAATFVDWEDQVTGQRCRFTTAEDGETRCLPIVNAELYYTDPACTQAVLTVSPDLCAMASPSEWSIVTVQDESTAVCPEYRYRVVHATGASESTAVYWMSTVGCAPTEVGSVPLLFEPAAASDFVAAYERQGEPIGSLAPVFREADDGSSQIIDVVDVTTGHRCGKHSGAFQQEARCVPNAHVAWRNGHYFADAACTDKLAYSVCDTPIIVFSDDPADCSDTHVFALGDKFEGTAYVDYSGTCEVVTWEDHLFYRFGAETFDQFPGVEDVDSGTGRVVARRWGTHGAALSPYGQLMDASTGAWCLIRRGSDVRCAPPYYDSAQALGYFSDNACSSPLLSWDERSSEPHGSFASCPSSNEPASPPPTVGITGSNDCGDAPDYVTLGAEWTGARFMLDELGACQAVSIDTDSRHFVIGEPVDPSTFPLLVDRVE